MTRTPVTPQLPERRERAPDILGVVKDRYSALTPGERSVADVILSDLQRATTAPNGEIATRAGVSQPTVMRFCRSVGCEGVRDFKLQLARSLAVGEAFLVQTAPQTGPGEAPPYWTSILSEAHGALHEVERQLSAAQVFAAADALAEAGRVTAFGLGGSSGTLAEEAQVRLFRYGVPVMACREPHIARMAAATLKPGDVFLALSSTGRTSEVIDAVSIAARYGAKTIAITRPESDLARAADIALTVWIGEYPDALTPSASRFAFLAILDVVAAATGYRLGPSARENLRRIKFNIMDAQSGEKLEPLGD
jgi:RpiR family transcriptional regulator, carbohydrate utilization regulator